MRFESEEHKTTFDVPDRPTGRIVLDYEECLDFPGSGMYGRLWAGACKVAQNWNSPVDLNLALLDTELPPELLAALKWSCLAVFSWYLDWKAGNLPKN